MRHNFISICWILLCSASLSLGCVNFTQGRTTVESDPFTGNTISRLENLQLSVEGGLFGGAVRADITSTKNEQNQKKYTFSLLSAGLGSIMAQEAYFLVDGERFRFEGVSDLEVLTGGGTHETLVFPVEGSFLQKLGAAKEVRVKMQGSKGDKVASFDATQLKQIKEFLSK